MLSTPTATIVPKAADPAVVVMAVPGVVAVRVAGFVLLGDEPAG